MVRKFSDNIVFFPSTPLPQQWKQQGQAHHVSSYLPSVSLWFPQNSAGGQSLNDLTCYKHQDASTGALRTLGVTLEHQTSSRKCEGANHAPRDMWACAERDRLSPQLSSWGPLINTHVSLSLSFFRSFEYSLKYVIEKRTDGIYQIMEALSQL